MTLDAALAAWRDQVRLPDPAAAEIRDRILASPAAGSPSPPGLDVRWWRKFTTDLTQQIVSSTRPMPVRRPAAWAA